MTVPGTPSLIFLAYLLLFLPWVALRRSSRLRGAGSIPPRRTIWTGTLSSQIALLFLAWMVGRTFGYEPFAGFELKRESVAAALLAIALCFVLRAISRSIRSADERRKMAVYAWAPRTPIEWVLWIAAVLVASVAEELAYRGVGMSILWYSLGNPWVAVLISASAFAVAHSTQGWKSAAIIFGVALVMHALVAYTATLVFAMIVHAVYDLIAGYGISRTARQYEKQPATA